MKLRWGICSAGSISHDFVSALSTLPAEDHAVVAVAARSEEKAKAFAEEHKIPRAYGGYEALAQDADVDIVYIGAVNHVHLPLCKLFLGRGYNVLCEKPLGLSKKEVQQMVDLAREKSVFFMEGLWTRFFPATIKLREILSDGVIGDIKTMAASFGYAMSQKPRISQKELGGGGLLDLGIYPVQEAVMIFGQAPLSATTVGFLTDTGVDETTVTNLIFPNKAVATLSSSVVAHLPNELDIRGTKGFIKVPVPFWAPTKLEVGTGVGGRNTEVFEFPLPENELTFRFYNSCGFRYEAECVRQCLMKGLKECPTASLNDSLLIAEILEKARHDVGYVLDADH